MGCFWSKRHAVAGGGSKIEAEEILPQNDAISRLVSGLRSLPGLLPNHTHLELKPSLLNNPNLLLYIKAYMTNANSTLEFLNNILQCHDATRKASSSLKDSVMFFNKKDYMQSLSKMKDFEAAGNPFNPQLFYEHSLLVEHHKAAKDIMQARRQKLVSKMTFVKLSGKVWEAVCKAALVLTLVSAMVLTILGMPIVASIVASTGPALINTVGHWLDAILKGREEELKEDMEVIRSMLSRSLMGKNLETMRVLVERVENHLGLLAIDVEFVVRVEDEMAVMVAINGIRDRLTELDNEINRLETKVRSCISEIEDAVTAFFKLIKVD